jgi:LacI family transcriptional regulator
MAETLGVSIGTVDRALHDRPGISPATRRLVLDLAEKLGYRPNLAARLLSSRRRRRVAVLFPRELASFWDLVRDGVFDVARSLQPNGLEVVYRPHPSLVEGEAEAIEEALREDFQGILLAPGRPQPLGPLIREAGRRGVAVICVNTDAPGSDRLCTVSVDAFACGGLAGELMGRFLGGEGKVVVVTGFSSTIDHAEKQQGFVRALRAEFPGIQLAAVVEAHDDEDEAYLKCVDTFARVPDLAGVYVTTANSPPVMRALAGREGTRPTVITSDLFPALVPLIQTGHIAATIDQRPWIQGQIAFRTMYGHLIEGVRPPSFVRLAPHVVMRSNLGLSLARMTAGDELAIPATNPAVEAIPPVEA